MSEKQEVNIPPIYKVVSYKLSQVHRIEEWVYCAYPGQSKKDPLHGDIEKHMFVGFVLFPNGSEAQIWIGRSKRTFCGNVF